MAVKQQLLLLALVCFYLTQCQSIEPIGPGPWTIKPCTTQIFRWNVQGNDFDRYTISLTTTTILDVPGGSLNIILTKKQPNTIDPECEKRCNLTAVNNNFCTIEEGCGVAEGDWFVIVTSTGASDIEYQFNTHVDAFTRPIVQLNVLPDKDAPLDYRGVVTREANVSDPVDKYDYFYFDVNPSNNDVEGTMVVIEISLRDVDPVPTTLPFYAYLNYGPNATYVPLQGCSFLNGVDQLEIPPCYFKQGGRWYLSVLRSPLSDGNTTYTVEVKVFKQAPRIVDIKANTKVYDRLLKLDDVVYFRFNDLINADVSKTVMFAVIDNVVGGQVEMQTNYQYLPFGDCTNPKECLADTGCHTRYAPCELSGNTKFSWYIGVRVRYLYDTAKPVTFTVSFDLEKIAPKPLPINGKTFGLGRHGQYQHYTVSKNSFASTNDWFEIYVYMDATHQSFLGNTQGYVYISGQPYAGADGCFTFLDSCTLSVYNKDIKACSIQLDPCELVRYPETLYISVFLEDTSEYYWYQTNIQYTIETKVYNPATRPYFLYDGSVRTGVVAEGEYSVYKVPGPLSGRITITASSVDEGVRTLPADATSDICQDILVTSPSSCLNASFSCCLCGSKCQSSSKTCNTLPNEGCSTLKRQLGGETQIRMHIFYGDSLQAPSCNCWKPYATYEISADEKKTHYAAVTGCSNDESPKDGLYVVIEGNVNTVVSGDYRYRQNEFAVSVETESIEANFYAIPLLKGTLQYGKLFGTTRYVLNFDRKDLMNHALVITTQAHRSSGALTNAYAFRPGVSVGCGGGDFIGSCQVNANTIENDGYCTITLQPCQAFVGNEDSTTFIVEVSTSENVDETDYQFSIYFDLVPQTPMALSFGQAKSVPAAAYRNLYKHFVVDVPASAIKANSLVVSAFYDAGHLYKDDTRISMFVNTPRNPRKAGQPFDCLCHETVFNQTRKAVFVVDTCQLVAGKYYFSILTNQNIFADQPQYFTIKAELFPAVVASPKFVLNKPIDYSVYPGQSVTFRVPIPTSMITSTTDVEKVLRTRLTSTNEIDTLTLQISQSNPANCFCDLKNLATCNTDVAANGIDRQDCEIDVDYCSLTAGDWFATVTTGLNVKDPFNPIPFTLFLDKTNLQGISQIQLSQGCEEDNRARVTIDDKVLHMQHHHYKVNGATGEEVATLYIRNVTDGSVTVYFNENNLATSQCSINAGNGYVCSEGMEECIIPTVCSERLDFISLYGVSTNKNNPVRYNISICNTPTSTINLNQPVTAQTLDNGGIKTYKTSLRDLPQNSALAITLTNTQNAAATITISQAICSGCIGNFARTIPTPCAGDCSFVLLPCDLPLNYRDLNYNINVRSATDGFQYDITLKTINLPQPTTIQTSPASSDPATFNIAPLSYAVYAWNIGAGEIKSFEQGLQRARFELTAKNAAGANVQSAYLTSQDLTSCPETTLTHQQDQVVVYGVAACCVSSGTYYVSLFNRDLTESAEFTIKAVIDQESAHQTVTWNSPETTSVVTVPAYDTDSNAPPVAQEARLFYPGLDAFDSSLIVRVEKHTDDDFTNTAFFISQSLVAGDPATSPCFATGPSQDPYLGALTYQQFSCEASHVYPDDFWFGFVNKGTEQRQFNITVVNYPASAISFGQKVSKRIEKRYARETSIVTQYKLPIDAVNEPTRSIFIEVEAVSEDIIVYVQKNSPAGSNLVAGCLSNFANATASPGNSVKFQFDSCTLEDGLYYIGIQPTSKNSETLEYNIHAYLNASSEAIKFTNLPFNTELTGQTLDPDTNDLRYELKTNAVQNFSYIQLLFNDVTPDAQFTYNVEGNCDTFSTMYCNSNAADETCSTIIYPCQVQSNANYHFRMTNYVGTGWSVKATLVNPQVTDIEVDSRASGSVSVHELKIYRVSLNDQAFLPGQRVQVALTSLSCGEVEVWINKHVPAGATPDCNINANKVACTAPGCTLASFDSCQTLYEDIAADYYITVRGLNRYNVDPSTQISYTLSVFTTEAATVKEMHTNEESILYASVINETVTSCPMDTRLIYPQECCPVTPPGDLKPYVLENVYWGIPVEGAHFYENYPVIELQLNSLFTTASISVFSEAPQFCGSRPQNPIYSTTCTATSRCEIVLPKCTLRDHRQIFLWVDPSSVGPTIRGNTAQKIPVASIRYRKHFYTVVDINFSTQPQYLKYTLRDNEVQYFRVKHNERSRRDYWFRAQVIQSENGRISLFDTWDLCNTSPCTEPQICNSISDGACTATLPPCNCRSEKIYCSNGIDRNGYSYLMITPFIEGANNNSQRLVTGRIQFDFVVPVLPIPPNCDEVEGTNYKFYDPKLTPTNEQIWNFRVRALGPASYLSIGETSIPFFSGSISCSKSDGCTSLDDSGCQPTQTTRDNNFIYYRRESMEPILSVNGAQIGKGITNYLLEAKLLTVPVQQLQNRQNFTTPSVFVTNGCVASNRTEYYKYTPQAGDDTLLVELYSRQNGSRVYMYPGHVTYMYARPGQTCATAGGYCSFLVACDLKQVTYYFHVPFGDHTIRVSSFKHTVTSLNLGETASFVVNSPGQLVVYELKIPGGNSQDPTKDLDIQINNPEAVSFWINRNIWGDSSCSTITDKSKVIPRILQCAVRKDAETFYFSFLGQSATCTPQSIYLRVTLNPDPIQDGIIDLGSNPPPNIKVPVGQTVRIASSFQTLLAKDELVYVRLPSVLYGDVNHKVIKGNHLNPTRDRSIQCAENSCEAVQRKHVSWHDYCFHCGIYQDFFVEITGTEVLLKSDAPVVSASVQRKQWRPLTSSSLTSTLVGPTSSMDFYSIDITEGSSHLLNILVTSGVGVQVEVYPTNCSLRHDKVTMWCFNQQDCQIPLPTRGNSGYFKGATQVDSLWTDTSLRVVVYGRDTTYNIRHFNGKEICVNGFNDETPFCGKVDSQKGRNSFGTVTTYPYKDKYANTFYNELFTAFSCLQKSGCDCRTLTQPCIDNLKAYSCETVFPDCSNNAAFVTPPSYKRCAAVEYECNATFIQAGLSHLSCFHNFYPGGVLFTKSPNDPGIPNIKQDQPANLLPLWIILGIIGAILLIVAIALLISKARASGEGDSDGSGNKPNPYVIL